MSKYNWTINDLEERLTKLKRMLKKESNPEKLELIQTDINSITDLCSSEEITGNTPKLLDIYSLKKDILQAMSFLRYDIDEFSSITEGAIACPNIKPCTLSKNDILELTHDFYKTLNPVFYGNFMKNFYRRKDHIMFSYEDISNKGINFPLLSMQESYIAINRDYTINDVVTVIHEYAHATSAIISPEHVLENKYLYAEIDSMFMELLAYDYLENIFKDGNAIKCKGENHFYTGYYASELMNIYTLMDYEKELELGYISNKQIKKVAKEFLEYDGKEVEDLFSEGRDLKEDYVISYMYAIELYAMYQHDPEKALNTLKQIIILSKENSIDYYKAIKALGILLNQNTRKITSNINQEITRLLKK